MPYFPPSSGASPLPGAWHLIGGGGEPAFSGTWANYSTSPYPPARFRLCADGTVELNGMVKAGTNGSSIFTLPVGFRPATYYQHCSVVYTTSSAPAANWVAVQTDGQVIASGAPGASGFLSLAGVHFPVD